jgi:hypothetical protein
MLEEKKEPVNGTLDAVMPTKRHQELMTACKQNPLAVEQYLRAWGVKFITWADRMGSPKLDENIIYNGELPNRKTQYQPHFTLLRGRETTHDLAVACDPNMISQLAALNCSVSNTIVTNHKKMYRRMNHTHKGQSEDCKKPGKFAEFTTGRTAWRSTKAVYHHFFANKVCPTGIHVHVTLSANELTRYTSSDEQAFKFLHLAATRSGFADVIFLP